MKRAQLVVLVGHLRKDTRPHGRRVNPSFESRTPREVEARVTTGACAERWGAPERRFGGGYVPLRLGRITVIGMMDARMADPAAW